MIILQSIPWLWAPLCALNKKASMPENEEQRCFPKVRGIRKRYPFSSRSFNSLNLFNAVDTTSHMIVYSAP